MPTGSTRAVLSAVFLATISARAGAQQSTPGAPACVIATDPEYGYLKTKAIHIGGGAMYVAAREKRYLEALRGPEGQTLRTLSRGAVPLDINAPDPTILDAYFAPLPLDLDGETKHGVMFDEFRMIALAAKAAAAAGTPIDPNKPPQDIVRQGLVIVAYPLACGARTVAPDSLEILNQQGSPRPRVGDFVRGDAIAARLFGTVVPPMSVAAQFGSAFPGPTDRVKITYAEACDDGSKDVLLPLKYEPPRPLTTERPAMPKGVLESDPIVYLQTVIDMDGGFARPVVIGGPDSLVVPALEALRQWRAAPLRINGTPVVSPIVVQVIFR